MSRGRGTGAARLLAAVGVAAMLAWSLAPVLWQVVTALQREDRIATVPPTYLPVPPTLDNVRRLFERKPFGTYLANSLLVSLLATVLCVAVAAPAAAVLARWRGPGRRRALAAFLAVTLVPPILLLFPLYEAARAFGVLDRPLALVVPYAAFGLPLAVWILEAAFRAIPPAIDEAAEIDGLSRTARLLRVKVPLAMPAVATTGILVFMACWNELLLALTFLTRDERKTVVAGISGIGGASVHEVPWGQLAAGVVVATLPLVAMVLLFQRRIVSGLTRGAVKG